MCNNYWPTIYSCISRVIFLLDDYWSSIKKGDLRKFGSWQNNWLPLKVLLLHPRICRKLKLSFLFISSLSYLPFRTLSSSNYDEERHGRPDSSSGPDEGSSHSTHQQYLGDCNEGLPEGPAIDLVDQLPEGISKQDIINFGNYYRIHCEVIASSDSSKSKYSSYYEQCA